MYSFSGKRYSIEPCSKAYHQKRVTRITADVVLNFNKGHEVMNWEEGRETPLSVPSLVHGCALHMDDHYKETR